MRLIIHISPQEFPDSVQPWLRSKVLECRSLGIPWWPTPRLWNKLWKWLGTGCRYQPSKFTLQLHIKWLKRWSIEPCTYFKKFCLSNRSALLIPHYPMSMWKIPGVCDPRRHSAKAVMDLKTCADCVQHHLQQTALATGRKDPANVGILGNRLTWKGDGACSGSENEEPESECPTTDEEDDVEDDDDDDDVHMGIHESYLVMIGWVLTNPNTVYMISPIFWQKKCLFTEVLQLQPFMRSKMAQLLRRRRTPIQQNSPTIIEIPNSIIF